MIDYVDTLKQIPGKKDMIVIDRFCRWVDQIKQTREQEQ